MGLPEITLTVMWGYSSFSRATAEGTQRVATVSSAASRSVDSCERLQARMSPLSESYICRSRCILGMSALPFSLRRTPL